MERVRGWFLSHGVPAEELAEVSPHRAPRPASTDGHPAAAPVGGEQPAHAGPPRDAHGMTEPPDVLLNGGETFSTGTATLEAVWTPGHTPGHLCFYDRQHRLLFTGDHILPSITSNVSISLGTEGDPLGDYLDSVAKVGSLDAELVLPAHKHHFRDLVGRIAEIRQHHEARLKAILEAGEGVPKAAYEIASQVPWNVGAWEKMDAGLRRAAVGETLSHLEYLRRRGRTAVVGDDGLVRYTRTGDAQDLLKEPGWKGKG
jgi:glyoxylase-like metal-dependent hydrolase (beta-lactamase superfamily II)